MIRFELEPAIAILGRTPAALNTLLRGLPDAWIRANEGPGTWSPFDVVGHLVHGERTDWIPRAEIIRAHGEARAFEPFDRHAQFRESAGKSIGDLLGEFEALRARNLAVAGGWKLGPADLSRTGRHPDLGAVTLGQLLSTWVVHDLAHLGQITRTMAKQHAAEVGPWKAYFRVLEG